MNIYKLANRLEKKIAQYQGRDLARDTSVAGGVYTAPKNTEAFDAAVHAANATAIQQAASLVAEAFNGLDMYDAGYEQVRLLSGKLFTLAKMAKDQDFYDKFSNDLPEIRKTLSESMAVLIGAEKGKVQTATRIINGIRSPITAPIAPTTPGTPAV